MQRNTLIKQERNRCFVTSAEAANDNYHAVNATGDYAHKHAEAEKLRADVERYLAEGGKIQHIPDGASRYSDPQCVVIDITINLEGSNPDVNKSRVNKQKKFLAQNAILKSEIIAYVEGNRNVCRKDVALALQQYAKNRVFLAIKKMVESGDLEQGPMMLNRGYSLNVHKKNAA